MSTCLTSSGVCVCVRACVHSCVWVFVNIHESVQLQCMLDIFGSHFRNVTVADIQVLERRLLQTMDMIVAKKKRYSPNRGRCSGSFFGSLCAHTLNATI